MKSPKEKTLWHFIHNTVEMHEVNAPKFRKQLQKQIAKIDALLFELSQTKSEYLESEDRTILQNDLILCQKSIDALKNIRAKLDTLQVYYKHLINTPIEVPNIVPLEKPKKSTKKMPSKK